jgi:hypothetical protein
MKKNVRIFPKDNSGRWPHTISVDESISPIMETIIGESSGLIRLDDLQKIADILTRHKASDFFIGEFIRLQEPPVLEYASGSDDNK